MFDLVDERPMNLNFATKDAKSVMWFSYTQPLSKPEVREINKQVQNMTMNNVASNTAKPFIRTWNF